MWRFEKKTLRKIWNLCFLVYICVVKDSLRNIVKRTVEQYHMLREGDTVLVALSGGPDSVCLLDILEELQPKYALSLCVAHFNHKLRGKASDDDATPDYESEEFNEVCDKFADHGEAK